MILRFAGRVMCSSWLVEALTGLCCSRTSLPNFFDLSTGFAGELVQKCTNYGIKVAVVETSAKSRSTSFRQFASESNRGNRFIFVANIDEGMRRLNA
jgi:hypothetical protein